MLHFRNHVTCHNLHSLLTVVVVAAGLLDKYEQIVLHIYIWSASNVKQITLLAAVTARTPAFKLACMDRRDVDHIAR